MKPIRALAAACSFILAFGTGAASLHAEEKAQGGDVVSSLQDAPPAAQDVPLADEGTSQDAFLDSLFEQLAKSKSAQQAEVIEEAIWNVWTQSGSPSVDYLMRQGLTAMADGHHGEALIYFTQVVTLAPGYAEGWSKRSALYYLMEDYQRALKDLEQVLRLEPRHFAALGGLAVLLDELGDKEGALVAYRKVLTIHPYLDGAREAEQRLSEEVEGQGI